MPVDIDQLVADCISVLGDAGTSIEEAERLVSQRTSDPMMAKRLVVWIPEAFGLALISHTWKVQFSKTFSAKDHRGNWITIEVGREPIFAVAVNRALAMFHSGPREMYRSIAERSSVLDAASKALNAGDSIEGASLSGPALIGIPADVYIPRPASWWRRLFG